MTDTTCEICLETDETHCYHFEWAQPHGTWVCWRCFCEWWQSHTNPARCCVCGSDAVVDAVELFCAECYEQLCDDTAEDPTVIP